jgi:hypothetical protein
MEKRDEIHLTIPEELIPKPDNEFDFLTDKEKMKKLGEFWEEEMPGISKIIESLTEEDQ